MATGSCLHFYNEMSFVQGFSSTNQLKSLKPKRLHQLRTFLLSSCASRHDAWGLGIADRIYKPAFCISYRYNVFKCQSSTLLASTHTIPFMRLTSTTLTKSYNALLQNPQFIELVPAVGIIAFAVYGLGPLMRFLRSIIRNDSNWKKSKTYHISTSYLQPLLLWTGSLLICRVLDPVILPSETSQAVKTRFINFIRSLSTVLAFSYCLSSFIEQSQKFFMEACGPDDTRKMGYEFAGKAVYTAIWVAAISLFMELLGFSTQRWITAGGLGTVLLTLAGREIFTNFLSSVMIHATRPFVLNEWIQTKIEGYEVSGTVEHVGWWSPTIIRGDDREAIHIPNHKFTVNIVRNLTQKTHWRIKTHLAVSHLDVNKINNIVADMRKVLAKNPQIEQQRLHRRVFLENIDPESQALLILISCFVKTSHFEEYLCVKEAVLLDLLTVISHHKARLATPIRTVQKIYGDPDVENIPFTDTIYHHPAAVSRPYLLIDTKARVNVDDKARPRLTLRADEDQNSKMDPAAEPKPTSTSEDASLDDLDKSQQKTANAGDASPNHSNPDSAEASSSSSATTTQLENLEPTQSTTKPGSQKPSISESTEQADVKNEGERFPTVKPQVARPAFGDNIVLGVALEGSKRTLPIEEDMRPSPTQPETNESSPGRNGSVPSTSSKEGKGSAPLVDQRDQDS